MAVFTEFNSEKPENIPNRNSKMIVFGLYHHYITQILNILGSIKKKGISKQIDTPLHFYSFIKTYLITCIGLQESTLLLSTNL